METFHLVETFRLVETLRPIGDILSNGNMLVESLPNSKAIRVCLHVTDTKSKPRMKKILFTREFHPGMKQV